MPSYAKKPRRDKIATYVPSKLKIEVDAAAKKSGLSTARLVQFALEYYLKRGEA